MTAEGEQHPGDRQSVSRGARVGMGIKATDYVSLRLLSLLPYFRNVQIHTYIIYTDTDTYIHTYVHTYILRTYISVCLDQA